MFITISLSYSSLAAFAKSNLQSLSILERPKSCFTRNSNIKTFLILLCVEINFYHGGDYNASVFLLGHCTLLMWHYLLIIMLCKQGSMPWGTWKSAPFTIDLIFSGIWISLSHFELIILIIHSVYVLSQILSCIIWPKKEKKKFSCIAYITVTVVPQLISSY